MQGIHFISGLPRSGSTLLSALLRQNPRMFAAMTSPVASLVGAVLPKMSGASEFCSFFNDEKRRTIIKGMFEGYYADAAPDKLVFDTNRTWAARAPLLQEIFPKSRIICCVREVGWIIDSVEQMLRKNPLQLSRVFNFQPGGTVYSRVETLMNSDTGLVGLAWASLREAWFSDNAKRLIVINYNDFVRRPEAVMSRLYEELGEPVFAHDYDHVAYDEPDYDTHIGMPGLHKVRGKVEYRPREPCVPPDIFAKYADANFWLTPNANRKGAIVLASAHPNRGDLRDVAAPRSPPTAVPAVRS
jgi:sulfotransferase